MSNYELMALAYGIRIAKLGLLERGKVNHLGTDGAVNFNSVSSDRLSNVYTSDGSGSFRLGRDGNSVARIRLLGMDVCEQIDTAEDFSIEMWVKPIRVSRPSFGPATCINVSTSQKYGVVGAKNLSVSCCSNWCIETRSTTGFIESDVVKGVSFVVVDQRVTKVFGLDNTEGSGATVFEDIDYAVKFDTSNVFTLYEGGTLVPGIQGTYAIDDIFHIVVRGGGVAYFHNSKLLHSSSRAVVWPLYANCILKTTADPLTKDLFVNIKWVDSVLGDIASNLPHSVEGFYMLTSSTSNMEGGMSLWYENSDIKQDEWMHMFSHWSRTASSDVPKLQQMFVNGEEVNQVSSNPPEFQKSGIRIKSAFTAKGQVECGSNKIELTIEVESHGATSSCGSGAECGFSSIKVKRGALSSLEEKSLNKRGFNVVVIDPITGETTEQLHYDTFGDQTASLQMKQKLELLPAMSIIVISVKGSAIGPFENEADAILRKLSNDYLETVNREQGGDGSEAAKAALNCEELKLADETAGSGKYWIRPHASLGAVQTYCDMINDNQDGGWTLVYKNAFDSPLQSTSESNPSALETNNIASASSGKLSDDHIRSLCSGQFRVTQTDSAGSSVPLNPIFCKFVDISKYGDNRKSGKWCSQSYSTVADYSVSYGMSTGTSTYGFSTEGANGAIVTQVKYIDSTKTGAALSENAGSGSGTCTPFGGCNVQVWCKSKTIMTFAETLVDKSSFALISQKTTGMLPSFVQFMSSAPNNPNATAKVETKIDLEAPSQDVFIGGGYKDSISDSSFLIGKFPKI